MCIFCEEIFEECKKVDKIFVKYAKKRQVGKGGFLCLSDLPMEGWRYS